MKSLRLAAHIALMTICSVALAQSDAHNTSASTAAPKSAVESEAQMSFDKLKTLAGTWEGIVTTVPLQADVSGKVAQVSLRVTSMGNALVHEARSAGRPDDPITMFYLDDDRLLLTHYCDAGNRPRMVGKMSPDGKEVEFTFLDLAGGTKYGHMDHAVFTFIDDSHHIEEWTYMMPGDKPVHAHFDLQRKK